MASELAPKPFNPTQKIAKPVFRGEPNLVTTADFNRFIDMIRYEMDKIWSLTGIYSGNYNYTISKSGTTVSVVGQAATILFRSANFAIPAGTYTVTVASNGTYTMRVRCPQSLVTFDTDPSHTISGADFDDGTSYPAADHYVYGTPSIYFVLAGGALDPDDVGALLTFSIVNNNLGTVIDNGSDGQNGTQEEILKLWRSIEITNGLVNGLTTRVAALENAPGFSIADRSITAIKIAVGNVTATELGTNAVTAVKIADGNVIASKLAAGVALTNIGSGGISQTYLGANSVGTSQLINANVTAAKLASGVALANIGANGMNGSTYLAARTVGSDKLALGAAGCRLAGSVTAGGVVTLTYNQQNVSVTAKWVATGVCLVTHNSLGNFVVIPNCNNGTNASANAINVGANSFEVATFSAAGASTSLGFTFAMFG